MKYRCDLCDGPAGHFGPCRPRPALALQTLPPDTEPGPPPVCTDPACDADPGHEGPCDYGPPQTPRETPASMRAVSPLEELVALCGRAGADEQRVLLHLARRLVGVGQRDYGRLDLANDRRNFDVELTEELADAVMYCAFAALKRESR